MEVILIIIMYILIMCISLKTVKGFINSLYGDLINLMPDYLKFLYICIITFSFVSLIFGSIITLMIEYK